MILQNQIKCNHCHDRIYSTHRHDLKMCECGKVGVDGGMTYVRRIGTKKNYTEESIDLPSHVVEDLECVIEDSNKLQKNNFGVICAIMRKLHDLGYNITYRDTHTY